MKIPFFNHPKIENKKINSLTLAGNLELIYESANPKDLYQYLFSNTTREENNFNQILYIYTLMRDEIDLEQFSCELVTPVSHNSRLLYLCLDRSSGSLSMCQKEDIIYDTIFNSTEQCDLNYFHNFIPILKLEYEWDVNEFDNLLNKTNEISRAFHEVFGNKNLYPSLYDYLFTSFTKETKNINQFIFSQAWLVNSLV